jgi:DNA-binding transcriptional MerR regulator
MENKIYLIKDIARLTGYSIHTIKFYANLKLIKEIGRSPETNFRYFDDTTIKRLLTIRQLRKEGRSIKEIKRILGVN